MQASVSDHDNKLQQPALSAAPYIEVAVALPLHHTYTYKVPDHLLKHIDIGMRVLVPFGRRRITGYVVGTKKDSGKYQAKLILDLLDDGPLFPESMLPFFRWIAAYYIHPLGEVIKTALPVGLNSYDVAMVTPTKKGIAALEDPATQKDPSPTLTPSESAVLEALRGKKTLSLKQIIGGKNPFGSRAFIKKMEAADLISVTAKLKKDQIRMKLETFVTLACIDPAPLSDASDDNEKTDGNISHRKKGHHSDSEKKSSHSKNKNQEKNSKNKGEEKPKLSAKRKEILNIVSEKQEISLANLKKDIPTAARLVKLMVADGYLATFEKKVFRDPFGDTVDPDIPPQLTDEQSRVVDQVKESFNLGFNRYLLCGVTGSGKTEVYMRLVTEAVARGKGAIVLVPEISLISQTERRFRARFGNTIAVLHSGLSQGELLDQWHRIASGEVTIVIGARSAIFAPAKNLGMIIVDEEHDLSYKQETGLRYNARDLAVVRAQQNGCSVVLGSATPSIQSYFNAQQGKFRELTLKNRVNAHPLPQITLVDLKKYKEYRGREKLVTPELSRAISACLAKDEQVIIFLNRRGFATFPVCESCGEAIKCRFCDITMTLHKDGDAFRCHLCGFSSSSGMACPSCKAKKIKPLGFGTERIETLLKGMFPHARIARLDQDTGSKKGATVQILKKVKNHTVDIIVGTQMLAKGHDFANITLVGVICADLSLNFPDFRAGERTFQLLAQVAGRAGRGEKTGKVIMQTYNPDHFSIEASRNQDFIQFYNSEIPFRKALSYPPYSRIIQLKISGPDMEKVKQHALIIGERCHAILKEMKYAMDNPVQVLGPIEAGIPKIALRYRWQILLKSPSAHALNTLINKMLQDKNKFSTKEVSVGIDVDPYFMM